MRFKIEYADVPQIGGIFAQYLDHDVFNLAEGSTLGGIPIKPHFNMLRALDSDGNPRMDVYHFWPCNKRDATRFVIGEIVELVIPDR